MVLRSNNIFTCVQVLDHGFQGLCGWINGFSQEFTSGSLWSKQPENKEIFNIGTRTLFRILSHLKYHYGRFGVRSFIISMYVKTVQIEFFAIKIIISIHISSLKKVWPKWKNWQKKILILLTENQFSWTFFALY